MNTIFMSSYYPQLARGDYQIIARIAVDQAEKPAALVDLPWIIGSLSFLGRSGEAEGLFKQHEQSFDPLAKAVAQFFLAVCFCREGKFRRSRTLLLALLKDCRSSDDLHHKFFAFQGLAFFRYSTGRLDRARSAAETALRHASALCFPYGTVLSQELLGHIQLSSGQFHNGFRSFDRARSRSFTLGQGALHQAIEISTVLYKASYGIARSSEELLILLNSSIQSELFADSYTQVALSLELARVMILRGDLAGAKEQLESSSPLVYAIDNPDLEMDYNLQLASLLRCRGEYHQALSIVRATKFRVQGGEDIRAKLKVLGFELQLLKALGRLPEHDAGLAELSRLSRLSGSLMARRYLSRHSYASLGEVRQAEDLLGDLIDRVASFRETVVPDILRGEWYGLLSKALNIPPADQVLYFDAELGSLTLFDQGHVHHIREGCSTLIRKLLHILAEAPSSKERLALKLWQQDYNPLRHDGLIYAIVAKARKVLGRSAQWIEAYEHGYRLRTGVRMASPHSHRTIFGPESHEESVRSQAADDSLHPRHRAILNLLQIESSIEPRELVKRLGVSDATVSRDMSQLMQDGTVERIGRGRAIRYVLNHVKTGERA